MNNLIKVGITQGDVNGVGPEVIIKTLSKVAGEDVKTDLFTPVIFGVPSIFQKAIETLGLQNFSLNIIDSASEAKTGKVNLVQVESEPELHPGEVRKDAGESAVEALELAAAALKDGSIDVMVTAPISKEAVQSDKFHFPGHTEFLSERLGEGEEALMILCNEDLRVALTTIHIPVTKISENITTEKIKSRVEKFATSLKRDYGIVRPSIAVLSLNPHAGDGGLLGEEEEKVIEPAISSLNDDGYLVFGPFAADGFFGHGVYKKFDGVLAMYHDQGLAPFKTIAQYGVNYSAGLPYVRTSPDHGTAYDIAWSGKADETSMKEAIYMAIDLFRRRKIFSESSTNPLKKHVHEKPERTERFDRSERHSHADKPE